jgi:hypothetical protein
MKVSGKCHGNPEQGIGLTRGGSKGFQVCFNYKRKFFEILSAKWLLLCDGIQLSLTI